MFCGFNYYITLRIYCVFFNTRVKTQSEITRCSQHRCPCGSTASRWRCTVGLCGRGKSTLNQYRPQVKQHSRLHFISVGASDALWDIYGAQYQPQQAAHCGLMWVCLGQCPHTNPKQAPLLDNLLFVCLFFTGQMTTNTVKHHSTAFHQYYSTNRVN